jgi:phosphoesterase RecJ-like protein
VSDNGKQDARAQVLQRIRADDRFVLVTHENPDGDALGSLVAMHGLLTALDKDSVMFMSAEECPLPYEYRFFDLDGLINELPDDIDQRTVIFLDCGNIDRNPAHVVRAGAQLLNIDHHHDNTHFGTINHVVPEASCTAEIVWDLMSGMGVTPGPTVAEALYVGLITDTGRFMYENTGPRSHVMAAELIAAGVSSSEIYRRLYEDMPYGKLALLARALENVQRFDDGTLTVSFLSAEDYAATDAEESYSEGIIDHLRAVRGTKVAALIRDKAAKRGERKVSLRATDDDIDVSAIARAQSGGGHRRAAGFSTTLALDELIEFLRGEVVAQLRPAASASVA